MAAQVAEIIDVQLQAGQEVLNVYHFVDTAGTASIPTLAATYISDVLPLMKQFQSSNLSHQTVKYRQVAPAATLMLSTTAGLPIAGAATGSDDLASCDALSGAWVLGDTTVLSGGFTGHLKRGGTRTAGVQEGMVTGNLTTGAVNTAWAAWVAELLLPGTGPWQLVVASFLNGARVRQHTVQAYALVTGSSIPAPSTQNTRKVLRGRTR